MAQWIGIALMLSLVLYIFFNIQNFKNYTDPISYTLNKYPELSCTFDGGKIELVDGKAIIKKVFDSSGKQLMFQEIDFGGMNIT